MKVTKMEMMKLVLEGVEHARRILVEEQKGTLMPVFFLISPSRKNNVVIGTPWNGDADKRAAVAAVKQMAHEIDAEAVVFSCETWMVRLDPHQKMRGDRPSESPDRIEGLQIVAVNRQNEWQTAVLLTKRDKPGGKIVSLDLDLESPGHWESWMFDGMFNPAPGGDYQ